MSTKQSNGRNGLARWFGIVAAIFTVGAPTVLAVIWIGSISSRVGSIEDSAQKIGSEQRARTDRLAKIDTELSKLYSSLIEVETQFCAADIVRNLMHADDMRLRAVMWGKIYPGTKMPTDNAYYPTICNRKPN